MYNTLMKKLIWGVRQFAILNLHFFDWETACFIICQAARNGSGRQKNGLGYPPGLRLGVKNADIGTLEVSFFFAFYRSAALSIVIPLRPRVKLCPPAHLILNIYHNLVFLNID